MGLWRVSTGSVSKLMQSYQLVYITSRGEFPEKESGTGTPGLQESNEERATGYAFPSKNTHQ